MKPSTRVAVARKLADWFEVAQRDLAWRRTRDPYAIWVSEVMLQQTRVETVEVYYPAFLARFPTVEALAAAEEADVLDAWSGLGYYRRARFLHRGARYVVETLEGRLPVDRDGLRAIPGVGPYTAGAIGSIAFDRPIPLVDGNVARVRSRLEAIAEPRAQDATSKAHWVEVEALLEEGSPRVLAQALMELGATVCTPRNPRCDECPVRTHCAARKQGLQGEIPAPKKRKKSPETHYVAAAATWGDRLLLERRPAEGLLASMWCFPLVPLEGAPGPEAGAMAARTVGARLGLSARVEDDRPGPPVKHVFTHRVWHLHPWRLRLSRRPKLAGGELTLVGRGERPQGGMPTVTEKVLEQLGW